MRPIELPKSAVNVASVDLCAEELITHPALSQGLDTHGRYHLATVDNGIVGAYGKTLILYSYVRNDKWLNPVKAWALTDAEAVRLHSVDGHLPKAWKRLVETK